MANIVNQYGQVKVGVRVQSSPLMSTLMNSLYSVYNADSVGLTSLKTSLYSAYNGESNANDSYGSNNGTAVGGLTYTTGKIGNAFQFNGSNSYIHLPENSIRFTNSFSTSFWLKTTVNQTGGGGLISDYYWGSEDWGYIIRLRTDNKISVFWRKDSTFNSVVSSSALSLNQWNHVSVVWDKVNTNWKIYINGVLDNQLTSINASNITYAVGSNRTNIGSINSYGPDCLNGSMDSINFWNKTLTQSEITDLYNSGNGSQYITDSFYKPTTNDALGTNNGTAQGGLTYTPGKIGTAFSFNGTNAIVEYPANSMNLTGDFTISFWTYMRSRDTNVIMSNYGNDGINRGFYIDSDGSYALRFVGNYLAPYYSLIKTDNSALFDMNVWMHFTFISKNGVGQWYKNGVANGASGNVMTNGYITNNKPIIGGFRSGNAGTIGSNKNMMLDAFTIWNKALTTTEITELYNSGNGKQYPFN